MSPLTIDVHAHWFPPSYVDLLRQIATQAGPSAERARRTYEDPVRARDPMFWGDLSGRLAMMDRGGVRTQVLSFPAPNLWDLPREVRAGTVRAFNDGCLGAARAYPGRFKLFANVPLPWVPETLAETERIAADADVVGIGACTHVADMPIDDARLDPVYRDWDGRGLVVFLHPDGFCVDGALADHGMEWSIGAPFDDQIATLRLLRSGLTARYPRITWIIPHLGGTFPFLYERIDQIGRLVGPGRTALPALSEQLSNILFDIVTPSARALRLARDVLGPDRLVHGSDFPYVSREDLGMGERLLGEAGFDTGAIAQVLYGTIEQRIRSLGRPPEGMRESE